MSGTSFAVLGIVIGYLAACMVIAVYAAKKTGAGSAEYFVAGGKLGAFVSSMTMLATYFSAWAFLGAPGAFFEWGTGYLIGDTLMTCFMVFGFTIIGLRFYDLSRRHPEWVTPCDMFAARFSSNAPNRLLIGIVSLLFPAICYLTIQTVGGALIITALTKGEVPYGVALAVTAGIMATYVAIGGMRAVAWTDVFQGMLFVVLAGVVVSFIFTQYGGAGKMWHAVAESERGWILEPELPPQYIFTYAASSFAIMLCTRYWMKTYAAKSKKAIIGLGLGALVGLLFAEVLLTAVAGSAIALKWPGGAPAGVSYDQLWPTLLIEFVGPVPAAFLLTSAIAAAMSSADTTLLACSAIVSKDVLEGAFKLKLPESKRALVDRGINVVIVGIAFLVSLNLGAGIVKFGLSTVLPSPYMLLGPVVMMLWWRRANKYGLIAGVATGLVYNYLAQYVIFTEWPYNPFGLYEAVMGMLVCAVVMIVVSLLTPPTKAEVIDRFFGRSVSSTLQNVEKPHS